MEKAVFFDRDGTLNLDCGYTHKIEDYVLLPGVKEGLKKLQEAGYILLILTSQSGIGRGIYTEENYSTFTDHFRRDLERSGVEILGIYHCPHHAEHGRGNYKVDCDCRKPKPGLILQAESQHGPFNYKHSWAIGDSVRDLEMAKNAHPGVRTILLPNNYGTESAKPMEETDYPDFKANNFLQAVEVILRESE